MDGKNIVITGGAGFIGSHLVDRLEIDNNVTVIDNLSAGRRIPKHSLFIKDDIRSINKLDVDADYLFHLAAVIDVQNSIKNPKTCHEVNIDGLVEVLEYARTHDVKNIIFSSSAAVYGTNESPINESFYKIPESMYGLTKLCGEEYCRLYERLYGIKVAILRYFNVYGPGQNINSKYAAVIPIFIKSILNNKQPVIYGDGNQTRDFIFVDDVINANIFFSGKSGTFNIASGTSTSINKLFEIIRNIIGSDIKPIYSQERHGDIKYSVADISKSKKEGFITETSLEDGLKKTIEVFKNE